jgi:hypothetical protein
LEAPTVRRRANKSGTYQWEIRVGVRIMTAPKWSFLCPHCNAMYQVIRQKAGPETVYSEITCHACGGPLPNREGKHVLKYFLLRKGARFQQRAGK